MDSNIELLKELLETDVITQEEFDAKVKRLSEQENKERKNIDYDELRNLEELRSNGVLNEEEYTKKVAQLCNISFSEQQPNNSTNGNRSLAQWLKKNAIAIVVIAVLIGALGFIGSKLSAVQAENTTLQSDLETAKHNERYNHNQFLKAKKSEDAVRDFYLDYAVITSEKDKYYHRYGCSRIQSVEYFWINNPEAVKEDGYTECPTCFGSDAETYINNHF